MEISGFIWIRHIDNLLDLSIMELWKIVGEAHMVKCLHLPIITEISE